MKSFSQISSQPKRSQPFVNLTEGILLPLLRGAFAKDLGIRDKAPDAVRSESVHPVELLGDIAIAAFSACMHKQRAARFRQCFDPPAIIADAVVNVVSVFLLEA